MWKLDVQLSVMAFDQHVIALELCNSILNGMTQNLLCYYSPYYETFKDEFWTNLVALISASNTNQLCIGDLNEVLNQSKKREVYLLSISLID